jgi:hypothetical protein
MQESDNQKPVNTWLKRIGWAGFLFFLIKGLIWLAVIYCGVELLD